MKFRLRKERGGIDLVMEGIHGTSILLTINKNLTLTRNPGLAGMGIKTDSEGRIRLKETHFEIELD